MSASDVFSLFLANENAHLRSRYPDYFKRAAELKAKPDRVPQNAVRIIRTLSTEQYLKWRVECKWCGDFFIKSSAADKIQTCGPECQTELRRWKNQRKQDAKARLHNN